MADRNDHDAMAQDLDIDEKQSAEVAGGANVPLVEAQASAAQEKRVIDKLPSLSQLPQP
jgi:hypothetical protein